MLYCERFAASILIEPTLPHPVLLWQVGHLYMLPCLQVNQAITFFIFCSAESSWTTQDSSLQSGFERRDCDWRWSKEKWGMGNLCFNVATKVRGLEGGKWSLSPHVGSKVCICFQLSSSSLALFILYSLVVSFLIFQWRSIEYSAIGSRRQDGITFAHSRELAQHRTDILSIP